MAVESSKARVADVLEPDERIRYVAHFHWVVHEMLIVGSVLVSAVVVFGLLTDPQFARIAVLPGTLLLAGIPTSLRLRDAVVVVTDRRLIVVGASGTPYSNWYGEFDAMTVERGLLGRLLGSGSVALWQLTESPAPDTTAFQRTFRVRKIQSPDELAGALSDATAAAGRRISLLSNRA